MDQLKLLVDLQSSINDALQSAIDEQKKELASKPAAVPLSKDELWRLVDNDETWEDAANLHVWVQPVGFNFVVPALLDYCDGEVIAVTSAMRDGSDWYYSRDYGINWVLYTERPEL